MPPVPESLLKKRQNSGNLKWFWRAIKFELCYCEKFSYICICVKRLSICWQEQKLNQLYVICISNASIWQILTIFDKPCIHVSMLLFHIDIIRLGLLIYRTA